MSATVSPVRVTLTGSAVDGVPYASLSWTSSNTLASTDTVAVAISAAPSPASRMAFSTTANVGASAQITGGNFANNLGAATGYGLGSAQMATVTPAGIVPGYTVAADGTARIGVAVNETGTYTGTLTAFRSGVALDTVSWSFTTTGKAASMTLTPASQNVAVNQTATMLVTLKDAAGRNTQPLLVDTVTTSVSPTGSGSPSAITVGSAGALATDLFDGVAAVTLSPSAAGSYTVTATPGGTLPAGGVTAQSGTVVAQATVALASAIVSAPTTGVSTNNTTYTAPASVAVGAPATSSINVATSVPTVTFQVTAATGTAGALIPVTVTDTDSGATSGSTTIAVDGSLKGTYAVTATNLVAGASYQVAFGATGAQVVYTVTYRAAVLDISNLSTAPTLGTNSFVKTGDAATVVASLTSQLGLPLTGMTITTVPSVSTATSGTTGADGKVALSIPAPSASTTSQTVAFNITPPFGSTTANSSTLTLTYNSSGAPSSVTMTSTAGTVAQTAAATQYVDVAGTTTGTWATTSVATQTQWLQISATIGGSAPSVPVLFEGTDVYFAAANTNNLNSSSTKKGSLAAASNGSGVASVFVKATKTGVATVKATAGTVSAEIKFLVANQASDARVITVTPAAQDTGSPAQVRATVTDAFGNTVANAALNFAEDGVGNFATGTSTLTTATGPNGAVVVDVLSPVAGDSTVTVAAGATANYAGAADAPVTGAPKGVSTAIGKIKFTGGSASKSITIVGARATVSGKPGIIVEGVTVGFENGKTVKPFFRFPGETSYTEGSARPVITDSEFTWQRKTGKKFYAYVTSDDGAVQSNRVIIAAN